MKTIFFFLLPFAVTSQNIDPDAHRELFLQVVPNYLPHDSVTHKFVTLKGIKYPVFKGANKMKYFIPFTGARRYLEIKLNI